MINLTTKIAIKIGKWYIKMLDRFLALARRFRRRRKFLENEGEGFSLPLTLLYIYYSLPLSW